MSTTELYKKSPIDFASPLLTFITYKIGSLNSFDVELINYCEKNGLHNDTIISLLIAQNKKDIEQILYHYHKKHFYSLLINIIKLKKYSAELKFRKDYGINTQEQLSTLLNKQNIW